MVYDEKADRFMIGVDGNGRYYCAAVSQTGDPTGLWNIYAFAVVNPATEFYDYPHAGVGEDAIYVGSNIFNSALTAFVEGRIHALDKAAMYAGAAAGLKTRNLGASRDTPQPMNTHGWAQGTWPTDKKHYILDERNYNGRDHTLAVWDGPFTGPDTFATVAIVDLNTPTGVVAGFPVDVVQSGGQPIQANDWRPLDFEYRNGFGWTTMTIGCNPGAGTVDCVRWAQINLATGAIGPQGAGVFSSNNEYRFFPDLAVNSCNDATIGYSKSSSAMFPSVWYTGREHGNPVGTLQAEAQLKAGEITYTAFDPSPRRWGDYTGMTIDPNGLTFWYLGEYSKNTGNANGRWGTYIGSFSYPECQGGGGDPTLHSGDLDAIKSNAGAKWNARVTVLVHDNAHAPISAATVTLNINNGALTRTCTTGATGTCYIQLKVPDAIQSLTVRVTDISKGGYTYNASANHDPDTDSDGTTIIVTQP